MIPRSIFIPRIGRIILLWMQVSIYQISNHIIQSDFVLSCFLPGVHTRYFPSGQQLQCCSFADVCDLVELFLCNDLRIFFTQISVFFQFAFHNDNHLNIYLTQVGIISYSISCCIDFSPISGAQRASLVPQPFCSLLILSNVLFLLQNWGCTWIYSNSLRIKDFPQSKAWKHWKHCVFNFT